MPATNSGMLIGLTRMDVPGSGYPIFPHLSSRGRQKDNRCSVQCRIGFNIFRATPSLSRCFLESNREKNRAAVCPYPGFLTSCSKRLNHSESLRRVCHLGDDASYCVALNRFGRSQPLWKDASGKFGITNFIFLLAEMFQGLAHRRAGNFDHALQRVVHLQDDKNRARD